MARLHLGKAYLNNELKEAAPHPRPSLAELARTALARAKVATVISRGRGPSVDSVTVVNVKDSPDGRPLVQLERSSSMVRRLAVRPVVTVSIAAPRPLIALQLTGPAMPCKGASEGLRGFRLSLLSARFVAGRKVVPVPLGDFHAASPDPLWPHAVQALEHLGQAHAPELLACACAHGLALAQAVVPRAIDRYGLELALITGAGVTTLRLPFPGGPVESLAEVTSGLRALLTCRCGAPSHRTAGS
jgi:Domain of unknown function (DUF2470)